MTCSRLVLCWLPIQGTHTLIHNPHTKASTHDAGPALGSLTHMEAGSTTNGGGSSKSCSTTACKVEMQPWHFWRKYGAKHFQVDGKATTVGLLRRGRLGRGRRARTPPQRRAHRASWGPRPRARGGDAPPRGGSRVRPWARGRRRGRPCARRPRPPQGAGYRPCRWPPRRASRRRGIGALGLLPVLSAGSTNVSVVEGGALDEGCDGGLRCHR
jgi:hypothetical protein